MPEAGRRTFRVGMTVGRVLLVTEGSRRLGLGQRRRGDRPGISATGFGPPGAAPGALVLFRLGMQYLSAVSPTTWPLPPPGQAPHL